MDIIKVNISFRSGLLVESSNLHINELDKLVSLGLVLNHVLSSIRGARGTV